MKQPLSIAIYHDLKPGGALRALVEMARVLKARGHNLSLYTHQKTDGPLDFEDFTDRVVIDPINLPSQMALEAWIQSDAPERITNRFRGASLLYLARSLSDYRKLSHELKMLDRSCRKLAREIDGKGHDIAFVHGSFRTQSPSVLAWLKTPSVYYAQEPLRLYYERQSHAVDDPYIENWRTSTGVDDWWGLFSRRSLELQAGYDRRNINRACLLLVNSKFSGESFRKYYGMDATVCYLGVDINKFKPVAGIKRERAVVSVGDLAPHKMHEFCVDSLGLIHPSKRPSLWIIGRERRSGARQALTDRAKKNGVDIRIFDDPPDEMLVKTYNMATATLLAAYREPFGFTALESMACETPVVAVYEGGYRETVADKVTGFVVKRSTKEFAQAVEKIINDPKLAKEMGKKGRQEARKWSWQACADRIEDSFLKILDRRKHD